MKNASQKFKMDEIMAAICNLHLYYNFALVLHEKSPHEESNLRPLDSVHRCSTTEPQGSVMLKLCSRNY